MPITPLHFGPASAVKAISPRYFSFIAFGISQLIIDLEPLYYMYQGAWPIHRFFHTYLGAGIVATLVILSGKPLCSWLIQIWNWRLSARQKDWLSIKTQVPYTAIITGAYFGGFSHVFFDSIMHADMKPFAPFSENNPLHLYISVDQLQLLCLLIGIIGGTVLSIYLFKRKGNTIKR
jgi:hypothetical protein